MLLLDSVCWPTLVVSAHTGRAWACEPPSIHWNVYLYPHKSCQRDLPESDSIPDTTLGGSIVIPCYPSCESVCLCTEGQSPDGGHEEAVPGKVSRPCPLTCLHPSHLFSLFISSRSAKSTCSGLATGISFSGGGRKGRTERWTVPTCNHPKCHQGASLAFGTTELAYFSCPTACYGLESAPL